MESLQKKMSEYRQTLEKGVVQAAYKGLMETVMGLRAHFVKKYPDDLTCGGLYYGYMDMTYFPIVPSSFKPLNLKIAVVYLHESGRFEAWLSAANKQIQAKTWQQIKASGWDKYHIVPAIQGYDSIIEHTLVAEPNFDDPAALTRQIERETLTFIRDIEEFLIK